MKPSQEIIDKITKKLADEGYIMVAGWVGFSLAILPEGCSEAQANDMKMAFYGGATHLFSCVTSFLDPGAETTESDLKRIKALMEELRAHSDEVQATAMVRMAMKQKEN